jgi:hypothetical protein
MPHTSRKLLRPSALLGALWCAFWLGVAGLHLYLFLRRLVSGEFTGGLDQIRLIMALAGALYCVWGTFRVGNVLRRLDHSPKKILTAALVLLFAHVAFSPTLSDGAQQAFAHGQWEKMLIVLPTVTTALTGAALAFAAASFLRKRPTPQKISSSFASKTVGATLFDDAYYAPLFQRPPPRR